MTRKLKALGLALIALGALGAMATSPAQAVNHHFTVPTHPSILTGFNEKNTKFELQLTGGLRKVVCEINFGGTVGSPTNVDLTITPTFNLCEVPGVDMNVSVDVNHCTTILNGDTDANGDAQVRIECAPDNEITITYKVFGKFQCVVHIPPQTPSGGAHYTQLDDPSLGKSITTKFTLEGIKYKETGESFCPGPHEAADGKLIGMIEMEERQHAIVGCNDLSGTERTTPGDYFDNCEVGDLDLELTPT